MAAQVWIRLFILTVVYTLASGNDEIMEICNQQNWCSDCMMARPECGWCNDEDFSDTRCSTRDGLKLCKNVTLYDNILISTENRTLHDGSGTMDPVQLQPQAMKVKLRVGQPYSFNMKYAVAENLPIDMYFVLDFTKTMRDRLQQLATLTDQLIKGLDAFTKNILIGYGSFVDKVLQPFTLTSQKYLENPCWSPSNDRTCDPTYGFIHRKKLNPNYQQFSASIANANTSSNYDEMEGGLDALMQAAVCHDITGWRNQSRRILVYYSDGGYHFAGDGKLAGVDKPNDGQCHLKRDTTGDYIYTASKTQDYPSLAQLVKVINENNLNTYFLVNTDFIKMYEELAEMSEQLRADTFDSDGETDKASEIVDKIITNYKDLMSKVIIGADKIPSELEVLVASNCGFDRVVSTKNLAVETLRCINLEVGKEVNFNVTITAKSCPADKTKTSRFVIAPTGLQEKLVIEVEYYCDCDCPVSEDQNEEKCSQGNGTYECGVCRCNPGRSGELCQCSTREQDLSSEEINKIQQDKCKLNNETSIVCSNKGLCNCGQCSCYKNHFGKHCECDKKKCQRPGDDELCSGNGECRCQGCGCSGGYTGQFCECPPADCREPDQPQDCSGRGVCECGRCRCQDFFNGTYCEDCKPQYLSKCEKCEKCGKNDCVKCLEQNAAKGDAARLECPDCATVNITKVDKFGKDEQPCPVLDAANCEMSYIVRCDDIGSYLMIAKSKLCPNPANALWIALPLLFGIMGVGILMLIIWKILTSFYDKIEYARFEHETQNPKWSQQENPIYKTATTTNQNPMYHGDAE